MGYWWGEIITDETVKDLAYKIKDSPADLVQMKEMLVSACKVRFTPPSVLPYKLWFQKAGLTP